jgi:NADP-reducing hydrogenase subunit HndD
MVAALRKIGFSKVYDTNFGADLTIMEEATEFLNRYSNKENLPLITSCCPGWVRYAETYFPDLLNHLSSCKAPQMMEGALIKTYYAQNNNIDPDNIVVVSIMPCSAKKEEIERNNFDVDIILTTTELANLIKLFGISFNDLEDETYDQDLLGDFTGAGVIFGVSGGVMEAALRTAYHSLTNEEYEKIEFSDVRGMNGIKEATLQINNNTIKVAVVHTLSNAKKLLDKIKDGSNEYDFIEVMACPLGCINGAGQPKISSCSLPLKEKDNVLYNTYKRANALYGEDKAKVLRQSHNNKQIQELYRDFLGHPGSHKAHELLHTTYSKKEKDLKE